jgi:hypothetical protein
MTHLGTLPPLRGKPALRMSRCYICKNVLVQEFNDGDSGVVLDQGDAELRA